MKKIIAVCLVVLLLGTLAFTVGAENVVSFGIRFESPVYLTGSEGVATVYATGLTEGTLLGGLETKLSFISEDLTFISADFSDSIVSASPATAETGCEERGGKKVVTLFFVDQTGVSVSLNENNEFEIAKIKFTVNNPADKKISIAFEDESIAGSLPFKSEIFDTQFNKFMYTFSIPATADTAEDFVFSGDATPVLTGGVIKANPVVCTAGPVMVTAKLHDAQGNMIAKPDIRFVTGGTTLDWDVTFAYSGPLTGANVTYYIWGLGSGLMKPVQNSVTVSVTE